MNPHAKLLLVCATKVESKAILDVFQSASNKPPEPISIADRMYHNLGLIDNTTVFMMQCEMGSVGLGSSLMTISKGINALSPDAVIMVGIAFGVNKKKQSIGDVLVSQQLMLYELQRVGTTKDNAQQLLIPRGDRPHASPWLLDRFRNAEAYWDDRFRVSFGLILSGEKLVDNVDFREQLKQFEPEAIGGEMEGAGLFSACQDAKVDWILVKAICDWADGHKKRNKSENQRVAAYNAATYVLHVLQQAPLKREGSTQTIASTPSSIQKSKLAQQTLSSQQVGQSLQISPLYISYGSADAEFVEELESYLNSKGIKYWRDAHSATAGRIEKQIDRAMRLNPTLLLILSEHSIKSDWVEHEVRTARELEKELGRDILCPIALDDSWRSSTWPKRLMEQIMEYNILDFSQWKDDSQFGNTFTKLIDGLELFYRG